MMQTLKVFNREKKIKKKIIIGGSAFAIIGVLLIGTSYAFYQKETEVSFISAKVRFPTSSEVTYTTTYNTSVKNVEEALNDLYGKLGS